VAAAIGTIAEAGFAGASFARIAGKLGISRAPPDTLPGAA
jgi:hypothetical protein